MTHIYIPKSSDMWCIHHYGSTEVNMHLDFLGPLMSIQIRAKNEWIFVNLNANLIDLTGKPISFVIVGLIIIINIINIISNDH